MSSDSESLAEAVDDTQLDHARGQGDYYLVAVEYHVTEVADAGATAHADPYVVGLALDGDTGRWQTGTDGLVWDDTAGSEAVAVQVALADAEDGRFVPECDVALYVDDVRYECSFAWHPAVNHYGAVVSRAELADATLRVVVDVPSFPRHDAIAGERFRDPVEVTFDDVALD